MVSSCRFCMHHVINNTRHYEIVEYTSSYPQVCYQCDRLLSTTLT
jgi:hypothetical protein